MPVQFNVIDTDIIIIGGGISGMTAAFYILEKEPSLRVTVLEANSRLGGRTYSIPLQVANNQITTFDLGGQWISLSQTHLMDLLKKLDIKVIKAEKKRGKTIGEFDCSKIYTCTGDPPRFGTVIEKFELIKFFEKLESLSETVTLTDPLAVIRSRFMDSVTMENYIIKHLDHSLPQNIMRNIIQTSCGLKPSQISILFYVAFCNGTEGITNQYMQTEGGAREYWIKGGASQICYKIAHKIGSDFIKTDEPVIEIMRNYKRVRVETKRNSYIGQAVIIAIPPKEVLNISFTPNLTDSRQQVLQQVSVGHLTKFVATYQTAFWRNNGFSGDILTYGIEATEGPIYLCNDITANNKPALTGYITDDYETFADDSEHSFKEAVLTQLAKYFGKEALEPIQYAEKLWWEEPYVGGCPMSCPGLDSMVGFHEVRRPTGRMYWAGTETATYWNGYMGGAVQAGYRAAIEVLYELRPQILTVDDIEKTRPPRVLKNRCKKSPICFITKWKVLIPLGLLSLYLLRKLKKAIF